MTPRLKKKYNEEITGTLKTEFGYTNDHQIPKITKVVLNMGLGEATQNPKIKKTKIQARKYFRRRRMSTVLVKNNETKNQKE